MIDRENVEKAALYGLSAKAVFGDLLAAPIDIDEAAPLAETMYAYLMGWLK